MSSPIKIAIVILNYNGTSDTLECLRSIYQMDYEHFAVIVIDNGSKQDPKDLLLKSFPKIQFIQNFKNLGFAEGSNIGIKRALDLGYDYVLLLNNDTKVDAQMLSAFARAIKRNSNVGIFGGKILRYYEPSITDHFGGFFSQKKGDFVSFGSNAKVDDPKYSSSIEVEYVCGCLMLIKREVIETIGFLEKDFFLLWEEADFAFRAKRAGFSIYALPDAKVWHKISVSFEGGKIHSDYYWWRNRLLWMNRNLRTKEKIALYAKVVIWEILKVAKTLFLKNLEMRFYKMFYPGHALSDKRTSSLLRNKARFRGILDYFFKRFGSCPLWVADPQSKFNFKSKSR